MVSNFGLYLSNIPDEITVAYDNVIKGLEPEDNDLMELIPGLKYTYYIGGIQTAALIESSVSINAIKEGILHTFGLEPVEVPIGYSISYNGFTQASDKTEC